jgi:hypothetical protein
MTPFLPVALYNIIADIHPLYTATANRRQPKAYLKLFKCAASSTCNAHAFHIIHRIHRYGG